MNLAARNKTNHPRSIRLARLAYSAKRSADRRGLLPTSLRDPIRRLYWRANKGIAPGGLDPQTRARLTDLYAESNAATAQRPRVPRVQTAAMARGRLTPPVGPVAGPGAAPGRYSRAPASAGCRSEACPPRSLPRAGQEEARVDEQLEKPEHGREGGDHEVWTDVGPIDPRGGDAATQGPLVEQVLGHERDAVGRGDPRGRISRGEEEPQGDIHRDDHDVARTRSADRPKSWTA